MLAKNPRRWHCEFCTFQHSRKKSTAQHELRCWKNPNREPWPGELTSVRRTGKVLDFTDPCEDDPRLIPWLEWCYHEDAPDRVDPLPKWWPGHGKIWTGSEWQDVPFYESAEITGAHGCAGGAGPEDHWPLVVSANGMWPGPGVTDEYVASQGTMALPELLSLEPLNEVRPASRRLEVLDKLVPWKPEPKKPREPFAWHFGNGGWWLSPATREALA